MARAKPHADGAVAMFCPLILHAPDALPGTISRRLVVCFRLCFSYARMPAPDPPRPPRATSLSLRPRSSDPPAALANGSNVPAA